MKSKKILNIKGALLGEKQLEEYLEKIASEHMLQKKSDKDTYPIERLDNNFNYITKTYEMLNKDLKEKIMIHPAGEWLIDNYYIIEENYKTIKKEMNLKKYTHFVGIANGIYKGFPRVYVLASEMVAYTEGKIEPQHLKQLLQAYQNKKTLNMEEIWNISLFFYIALIEKIRNICEKINCSQIQKYKVESMIERLVENVDANHQKFRRDIHHENIREYSSKETFIEYLSYRLKLYGKKGLPYLKILEEQVAKIGTTIPEVIKKEHFNIALQKVYMGNCIKSIKDIQRIHFTEIFEEINGVESILKQDPSHVYEKMDHQTKDYYRNVIKKLSQKTKISEIYITKKVLELARQHMDSSNIKQTHIGYYLISDGRQELEQELGIKPKKKINKKNIYIANIIFFTSLITFISSYVFLLKTGNLCSSILFLILLYIPISEIVIKIQQAVLNKIIKPKLIPKLYFQDDIPEKYACMVVMPTILESKEKTKEMMRRLEVFYLANQSKNLYFTLLGDCTTSSKEEEKFDKEIIQTGKELVEELNQKYPDEQYSKFNFIYRKRTWNSKENAYLGWERKRGILTQFNQFLLGDAHPTFLYNSMEDEKIPKIKYIITLDSDTELVLDSAKSLVGAMAHILNKPVVENKVVASGYGMIQPRIGTNIKSAGKSTFTNIFTGNGGVDFYSHAISDIYQDNFNEGIFTGKGIYDLDIFNQVLKEAIPEDTVLSHDLLEGLYLKCGLATDIFLFDSYPSSYQSYMTRQSRWVRGDWQLLQWLKKKIINKNKHVVTNPLGELDKFKILDNLRRSLLEVTQILTILLVLSINIISKIEINYVLYLVLASILIDFIIDFVHYITHKKEGINRQSSFSNHISNIKASLLRTLIHFITLPYTAYVCAKAIIKTLYRICKTKEHLLEWMTADEAEKKAKDSLKQYIKTMWFNIFWGLLNLFLGIMANQILIILFSILWIIAPGICYSVSKKEKEKDKKENITENDLQYLMDVAKKTWQFFKDYLIEENHYLPPDNYQESRVNKTVKRTSSTNIGLAVISVISAYDLKLITLEECLNLLNAMIQTIQELPKWNGHLYNWYNIETLQPLKPMYVSSVDSGNFIGYVILLKTFLFQIKDELIKQEKDMQVLENNIIYIENLIKNTDFAKLYDNQVGLLSIGFNIEENKLTPSYYDLLASEARQASLVAIAKKDIPVEHWNNLSRTLTSMDGKKGLISWSGTAFEYLMPNINIKKYKGSLLDESCKFMIMSQRKYCNQLGIPWGISESAFNLKDLNSNYQYKAFGIPWLGLKRGLADEVVVSSYASFLALNDFPEEVIENIKKLEKCGMYDQYGFYESIDYTPERVSPHQKYEIVKTYMAHHQALILLSINNFMNNGILQKRFNEDPHIKAVDILLQEKMPEDVVITKEKKEVVEKIKYKGYENYTTREIHKIDERINNLNVISNGNYTVCMNQDGSGFSKYKDILINRYKETEEGFQGIQFYLKNIENQKIWNIHLQPEEYHQNNYKIEFTPDTNKIIKKEANTEIIMENMITPNDNVEIRKMKLKNFGNIAEIIEVSAVLEPVLSTASQDYAHKAFNNLFLKYEKIEEGLVVKRNKRGNQSSIYLAVGFFAEKNNIGDLEFEIDKQKLYGRLNKGIPIKIKNSEKYSNEIGLVVDPIISFRKTIKIEANESVELNLVMSVSEDKLEAIHKFNQYKSFENVKKAFEISRIRTEEEARYLRITGKDIVLYQKMLSYILKLNPIKKKDLADLPKKTYSQQDLWKYGISGDKPILLITIKEENDIYTVREILKAYEYFITKKVLIDLVILDKETNIYEKYVKTEMEREIYSLGLNYLLDHGIYLLDSNLVEDLNLFILKANMMIDAHLGSLENIINEAEEEYLAETEERSKTKILKLEDHFEKFDINKMDLKYQNGYGGFSSDGKEYVISVNKEVPLAWSNVLANKEFGTIITQNIGGFTWSKNSRLNRISRWSNDTILDTPSEEIFIRDYTNNKVWRLGEDNLLATFGFGYAKYEQRNAEVIQQLDVFVPMNDHVKINILKIKNNENKAKKFNLIYKIDDVLGEDEIKTNGYIDLSYHANLNCIIAQNLYLQNIKEKVYVYSSEKINSYTGDRNSINIFNKTNLNNKNSLGNYSCMAIDINIELNSYEEKEIVFVLGVTDDEKNISAKYRSIETCQQAYYQTKKYWQELLEKVKVKTPVESINLMLNGWSMYQTIASRLYARSGFNQSGGAFGFRDQLQDCVGLEYIDTQMVKRQILKHAEHQFIEGDVEHWWHDETRRGIRTNFSDDRLWLVYLVLDYLSFTEDKSILEEKVGYIQGKILEKGEDENYDLHEPSQIHETIYAHCIRAINISLQFGEHGLPLIGTGDWNDGLNTVGNEGKGESVWLGFFLYDILKRFLEIVKEKKDVELMNQYQQVMDKLKKALNKNGWDGHWYKRAFTDNGQVLGSLMSQECKIDSIAQSWSVISDAGDNDKKHIALNSLEKHLIDEKTGIIKLLDPPFENSNIEPGYIKSYLPGVRENGGQYTHAAIWSIIAFAKLELKEKAIKYFTMINPIEHAKTKEKADLYKVEPYVIPADVYGSRNLLRTRRMDLVYWFSKLVLSMWYRKYIGDEDRKQHHIFYSMCPR